MTSFLEFQAFLADAMGEDFADALGVTVEEARRMHEEREVENG